MLPKAEQVSDLHFFIFLSISSTNYYPDQILVLFLHSESQKFLYVYLGTYIVNTTYILHLSIPLVYLYVSKKTASILTRGRVHLLRPFSQRKSRMISTINQQTIRIIVYIPCGPTYTRKRGTRGPPAVMWKSMGSWLKQKTTVFCFDLLRSAKNILFS